MLESSICITSHLDPSNWTWAKPRLCSHLIANFFYILAIRSYDKDSDQQPHRNPCLVFLFVLTLKTFLLRNPGTERRISNREVHWKVYQTVRQYSTASKFGKPFIRVTTFCPLIVLLMSKYRQLQLLSSCRLQNVFPDQLGVSASLFGQLRWRRLRRVQSRRGSTVQRFQLAYIDAGVGCGQQLGRPTPLSTPKACEIRSTSVFKMSRVGA